MITSAELENIPLFAGVEEQERGRLARRAADISLEPGEWLIREGEDPRFFVILEGETEAVKDIVGQRQVLGRSFAGEFSGEMPIFMGTTSIVSVRAVTKCRVARFERQQLQELVRNSPSAGEIIFQTMTSRLATAQKLARETPSSRVQISGSKYDNNCRAIRAFLSANRIQYDYRPSITEPESAITVSVEGTSLENPTVRSVAEALGFQTVPKYQQYDIIIAGAGPAGMAAAVYSASEGLKVLLVERFCRRRPGSHILTHRKLPRLSCRHLRRRTHRTRPQAGQSLWCRNSLQAQCRRGPVAGRHPLRHPRRRRPHRRTCPPAGHWRFLASPRVVGHDKLLGRGIFYGASRFDGVAVTGRRLFIVGGGNSAGQAAVFYSGYAAEVVILVRGPGLTQSMSQYLIQQVHDKANIRVEPYTQVTGVQGEDHLDQITTSSRPPDGPESTCTRDAKALFIMIGAVAKTQWLPTSLERDANGYICTGRDMATWSLDREPFALETSIPGIFCAGDVRHGSVKRVASGVGEGSMAIAFIHEYLALTDTHS